MNWEVWPFLGTIPAVAAALWFLVPRMLRYWEARQMGLGRVPVRFRPNVPLETGGHEPLSPTELLPTLAVGSFPNPSPPVHTYPATPNVTLRRTSLPGPSF